MRKRIVRTLRVVALLGLAGCAAYEDAHRWAARQLMPKTMAEHDRLVREMRQRQGSPRLPVQNEGRSVSTAPRTVPEEARP